MIDVTLTIGELDLHELLSTYQVTHETEYQQIMTALDGTEHGAARFRPVLTFSLIPLTDAQCDSLYDSLTGQDLYVTYTNPWFDDDVTATMRLTTNFETMFGISSINGNRYYKGGTITLRQRTVL